MIEKPPAAQINFSQLLCELETLTKQLQDNLIILSNDTTIDGHMPTSTRHIANITQDLTALIKQLMRIQNTTLFGYEYVNFCDLIICANAMANYLTTRRTASQWVRRYANYGKRLAPRLEPFLRRSWYHYSQESKTGDTKYQINESQNETQNESKIVKELEPKASASIEKSSRKFKSDKQAKQSIHVKPSQKCDTFKKEKNVKPSEVTEQAKKQAKEFKEFNEMRVKNALDVF